MSSSHHLNNVGTDGTDAHIWSRNGTLQNDLESRNSAIQETPLLDPICLSVPFVPLISRDYRKMYKEVIINE